MDKDLTLTDLRVYGAICMFANTHSSICFPKQQTIADRLGINVPMVSKSVGVLVEKGYILKGAKIGKDGRKKQNYYTIKYDIILQESELMSEDNSENNELMPQHNHELMPQHNSLSNINSFNSITPLTKKNKIKKDGFSSNENSVSVKNGKIDIKANQHGQTDILCPCDQGRLEETLQEDKYFCCECSSIYSKNEVLNIIGLKNSVSVNNAHTQTTYQGNLDNSTGKKNLQVEAVKITKAELQKQDEIENFVNEHNSFNENEVALITEYITDRKAVYKSKVKNTKQALNALLNDIAEVKKQIPLDWVFQKDGEVYSNCGTAGDKTKPFQTIKIDYFKNVLQQGKQKLATNRMVLPSKIDITLNHEEDLEF